MFIIFSAVVCNPAALQLVLKQLLPVYQHQIMLETKILLESRMFDSILITIRDKYLLNLKRLKCAGLQTLD